MSHKEEIFFYFYHSTNIFKIVADIFKNQLIWCNIFSARFKTGTHEIISWLWPILAHIGQYKPVSTIILNHDEKVASLVRVEDPPQVTPFIRGAYPIEKSVH